MYLTSDKITFFAYREYLHFNVYTQFKSEHTVNAVQLSWSVFSPLFDEVEEWVGINLIARTTVHVIPRQETNPYVLDPLTSMGAFGLSKDCKLWDRTLQCVESPLGGSEQSETNLDPPNSQ